MMNKSKPLDARCGIYVITPEIADALLSDPGAKNRPLAAARVKKYAARMTANRWQLNGEPIILSEGGKLLDGEHRLRAVIESKTTIETVVLWGPFSFSSMGQGAARSGSDALALADPNGTNVVALSAAVTLCMKHDRAMQREMSPYTQTQSNTDNWMDIDNADRIAWAKKNPRLREILSSVRAAAGKDRMIISGSTMAAAWFLIERVAGVSEAESFALPIITGIGLKSGDVRLLLRRVFVNRSLAGKTLRSIEALHFVAKAWELRDAGERRVLAVKSSEFFPFIR